MLASHNEIIYFLEVASTENISKAATRLGITQPTLTQSIKKLEQTLGHELLIRSKSGVQLTKAGKLFLKESRQLIEQWENLKKSINQDNDEIRGQYTIGCHPSVALYTLPYILPKLLRENPHLDIKLEHDLSRIITDEVISYNVDIGIVINPIKHPDLIIKKLKADDVTLFKSKELAGNKVNKILITDPDLMQSQTIMSKLRKTEYIDFKRLYTSSLETATKLCFSGCGYAILPTLVTEEVCPGKLEKVKGAPVFKDELCLIYRVENKNSKALQEIIKHITKQ